MSFIYKLLFNRTNKQFDSNDPELFHSDKYLRPDHKNYKQCPHCKIEAKTNKEIIDLFGVKNLKGAPSTGHSFLDPFRGINPSRYPSLSISQVLKSNSWPKIYVILYDMI